MGRGKAKLKSNNTAFGNRLQKSRPGEFIIDLAKPPGEVGFPRDRSPSKFRETGNSGIEINHVGAMRREEDQLGEMGDGTHVER